MRTFPIGGIHPSDNKKWSKDKAIEAMALPEEVADTKPVAWAIS